jgi:queuine tRNA-ribosyltransferase
LMQGLRKAIAAGSLTAFVAAFHARRSEGDIEPL